VAQIPSAEEFNEQKKEFICTEIKMGFTFADVARQTNSTQTRTRNLENAQKAHNTALKFLDDVPAENQADVRTMRGDLARLQETISEVRDLDPPSNEVTM
jgi:hypothetical protein